MFGRNFQLNCDGVKTGRFYPSSESPSCLPAISLTRSNGIQGFGYSQVGTELYYTGMLEFANPQKVNT